MKALGTYDEQANEILDALSNERLPPLLPEGWQSVYKALLELTNIPPAKAAEMIGLPYSAVLKYCRVVKDSTMLNLINLSLEGFYSTELQDPYGNQKNHQILTLGIKALTKMLDSEDTALPLPNSELDRLLVARIQFNIDLAKRDEEEIKEIELNKKVYEEN